MQVLIDKALTKQEKDLEEVAKTQTRGEEAAAVVAAVAAAVHTFFKQDFKQPELVTCSVGADRDFTNEWVKQKHTESDLSQECDQPYGI